MYYILYFFRKFRLPQEQDDIMDNVTTVQQRQLLTNFGAAVISLGAMIVAFYI
jgi:hypothetical protein